MICLMPRCNLCPHPRAEIAAAIFGEIGQIGESGSSVIAQIAGGIIRP
jgi:hypothetical protein